MSTFRIPLFSDINDGLKSWFQKLQEPFSPNKSLFPKYYHQSQYTATYSRDKNYLFDDKDPKFFSLATRSRIIEFLLKRKRFTEDPNDDFSFGKIVRTLQQSVRSLSCFRNRQADK